MSERPPLVLTVYKRCPDHADRGGCDYWVPADMHGPDVGYGEWVRWEEDKRLTDAELAAEYWAACAVVERAIRGGSGFVIPLARERNTMERFATHPHYDEGTPDE